jgi:cytochrome oxidase assembly protein ShyY1
VLLVNRGFVLGTADAPAVPGGRVEVVGRLRQSEVRSIGQPTDASGVVLTEIRRIDIPQLTPQLGHPVQPMYLDLLNSDPPEGKSIAPVAMPELDDGPHLSYTIQWFIFSACAVAGWVLVVRRSAHPDRPRKRGGPAPILESER